jgi:hypothetical protein
VPHQRRGFHSPISWRRLALPGQVNQEGAARDGEVGGDDVGGTVAWVVDGELPEIMPG